MKKLTKTLLVIVGIIILILVIIFFSRFITISKILKAESSNAEIFNYHMKYTSYLLNQDENVTKLEIYKIPNKDLRITEMESTKVRMLFDKTTYTITMASDTLQTVTVDSFDANTSTVADEGYTDGLTPYVTSNVWDKIKYVFQWKISTETIDDVECYYISIENVLDIWLDKTNMLMKKEISNYDTDAVQVYEVETIEVNTVTEDDVVLTGIEDYEYTNSGE